MTERQLIIPAAMQPIVERAGYVPAVKVGNTLYCAGQVGRTSQLAVIEDPEAVSYTHLTLPTSDLV